MNRKGPLIRGAALAAMLGAGLTVAVPSVGLRTASADTQADQQLEENLSGQFFRVGRATRSAVDQPPSAHPPFERAGGRSGSGNT